MPHVRIRRNTRELGGAILITQANFMGDALRDRLITVGRGNNVPHHLKRIQTVCSDDRGARDSATNDIRKMELQLSISGEEC